MGHALQLAVQKPSDKAPSAARAWLAALELMARAGTRPTRLLGDIVAEHAACAPASPALLSRDDCWSYGALSARISRYARFALAADLRPGDRVALIMGPGLDYPTAWMGLTLAGAVVALINPALAGASLAHSIRLADPRLIIADASRAAAISEAIGPRAARTWTTGEEIEAALAAFDGTPLSASERPAVAHDDPALLIYTSGTTGLPKAALVSHRRVLNWGHWFAGLAGATPDDRMYNCLPLHHSVGGVVAIAAMLVGGGSSVLAGSFSASRFWDDIQTFDCTLFQYIGELCRYLLKQPFRQGETDHRLRLACGNGLAGDIWSDFQTRFAIPRVLEFYAATEGNFSLFNVEGKPGSIGRVPALLAHRFPAAIVRFDADSAQPARGPDGFCIACGVGEAGEAIGRIGDPDQGGGAFEGYTDPDQTRAKILRDVFAPGDVWFRTGDLMRRDAEGFFYFVDRVGDTFRWKGENVSTNEVEAVLLECPDVREAVVYGVRIPGADGRAGMAAIVPGPDFDANALRRHLAERLPGYAWPVFLRLTPAIATTETFKLKKQELAREAFDPNAVEDPLFVADPGRDAFLPLTPDRYAGIVQGLTRF